MGKNLKKANRFIEIYNDIAAHPTMADVAEEAGLSLSRAKSLVSEIRKRNKNGEEGLKIIGSRVASGADQVKTEKDDLRAGQMVSNLGRQVPMSDEVREYREDWTAQDCIKHLDQRQHMEPLLRQLL